jgi:exopolyphosphatase/guanosine-5'-triphosphate,3'-diphosphate pyrophosphatase
VVLRLRATGMQETVPRYEFRAFAQDFGLVEDLLRQLGGVARCRESLEVYVVAAGNTTHNTKIRAQLLDIKELLCREQDCEQWRPCLKAGFPLSAQSLRAAVFPALGIATPELRREAYDLNQLYFELLLPNPLLRVASVHKRRFGYELMGCTAEVAEVLVNGARLKTASVESAHLDALIPARRSLGLDRYPNVSYPVAIQRVLGMLALPEQAYYRAL